MAFVLTISEKSPGQAGTREFPIEVKEERLTVRELIRNVVFQQVYEQNNASREWNRVIDAAEQEKILNKKSDKNGPTVDWAPKYEQALSAFENNQVLLLIDEKQVENLDDFINLKPSTKVTFLKMVPLVGG